jgi:hypothetical protein
MAIGSRFLTYESSVLSTSLILSPESWLICFFAASVF